jgi:hypothetical protein
MTPQEQELVTELFDRLAKLENSPRDPNAERLIADGLRRAPHAVYALVQTALVTDEALKRANARIEELQAQIGSGEQRPQGGFLDSMRDAVLGSGGPRGSVPRCARKPRRLRPRPISRRQDIPRRRHPILRVRAWARLLDRADRFSARPHRRQRG